MPIYGYRCSKCGHQFEIQQRMSDEPVTTCPKCQGKLTKVIYPTGVIYKGSGYYTTDYKASGKGSASANGSGSATETKPETKPESSPEGKSESKSEAKDSKEEKSS